MTVLVNLELPFPPTLNESYSGRKGGGGLFMTAKAKAWKETAWYMLRSQLPHKHKPIEGPLECHMRFVPPNRRGDADNRIKITLDALQAGGVIVNDRQIKRLVIDWAEPNPPGYVRLALESLQPPAGPER